MIKFYQNLQTGVSIAKALNNAQCWLRDVTKAELQKWTQELTKLTKNQENHPRFSIPQHNRRGAVSAPLQLGAR